jgi:hypothetical protein
MLLKHEYFSHHLLVNSQKHTKKSTPTILSKIPTFSNTKFISSQNIQLFVQSTNICHSLFHHPSHIPQFASCQSDTIIFNIVTCQGFCMTYKTVSGLDDWIYCTLYIHNSGLQAITVLSLFTPFTVQITYPL